MTIALERFSVGPAAAVEKLNSYATAIESLGQRMEQLEKKFEQGPSRFLAKITEWARFSGNQQRWRYAWTQVYIDESLDDQPAEITPGKNLLSGTTSVFYAINLHEVNNSSTAGVVQGHSIDQGGDDFPSGFEIKPVGHDGGSNSSSGTVENEVVVEMFLIPSAISPYYQLPVFSYVNAVDGTCD